MQRPSTTITDAEPGPAVRDGTQVAQAVGPHRRPALLAAGGLAAAFGGLFLAWWLLHPLLLLFAAVVIAVALEPIVGWLASRMPRALAVALVYLLLVLGIGGLAWYTVPALAAQGLELVVALPSLLARARTLAMGLDPTSTDQVLAAVEGRVDEFGFSLVALPLTLASVAVEAALVILLSAYWLISAPALRQFTLSLLPIPRRAAVVALLAEVAETIGGYVRGKALSVLVVGVGVYLGLRLIEVDFPLVLALIAAVAELIPVVGIVIATVPAVAVALLESPTQAVTVLVFFVVFQQIESNVLLPVLVRRQSGIPPLLAVFAIVAGQALAGGIGAIVAIPLAGALQVVVVRGVAPAIRRWTGAPPTAAG